MSNFARRFGLIVRPLAGLLVTVGFFALVELVLAAVGFAYHPPSPIIVWNRAQDEELRSAEGMHRFNPFWFWEPRPGAAVAGCGGELINEAGFRGPLRPQARVAGVRRIVALGDSSTFGMGVCANDTYSAQLESSIAGTEVLNFGVIGFSAFQGAKLFSMRAVRYRPDLVMVAFGAVDELLPAIDYDVDAKFAITSRSFDGPSRWADRLGRLRSFQLMERLLRGAPTRSEQLMKDTEDNWQAWNHGRADYRRTQTVPSFERSLTEIVADVKRMDASVIFIVPPRRKAVEIRWPWAMEYAEAITRVAAAEHVPVVDVRSAFRSRPDSDSTLFVDDYHPNRDGHRLYGQLLADSVRGVSRDAVRSR
jgi:lysophospholipase L1-like esterase